MTNPYAPPQAVVRDIVDPNADTVVADRGTRLGAAILDGIVFGAMVYLPMLVVIMIGSVAGPRGTIGALIFPFAGFVAWCWMTIRYVRADGQSIAKKLLGIKVVRTDGAPISLGRIFWLRNVVNGLLSIVPLYSIVDILFIFGEQRKCLHDRLADTIVVRA